MGRQDWDNPLNNRPKPIGKSETKEPDGGLGFGFAKRSGENGGITPHVLLFVGEERSHIRKVINKNTTYKWVDNIILYRGIL